MKNKKHTATFVNLPAGICFALLCAVASSTHADIITVTNTNDSGPGSLRQALANANNGDRINFAVTGTIALTSDGLVVTKNITISGPGANQLSIDGNPGTVVFSVDSPATIATISGLTIRDGVHGIVTFGTLTVSNCVVSGNSNGITNHGQNLTVVNSNVSDNGLSGISFTAPDFVVVTATIRSTTVSGNLGGVLLLTSAASALLCK